MSLRCWSDVHTKYTESVDVLLVGCDECIGAGSRKHTYEELLEAIEEDGLDPMNYKWYLETRKFGAVKTSGFGLGLQRILMCVLALPHIRDATMINRTRDCCFHK